MASNWLTADLVEQIHKAHLRGKETHEHVAAFSNTTLAGLVEYGCLKRSIPDLPPLPDAVVRSPLGIELNRITSEIGLRSSGPSVPTGIDHAPREIEFAVVLNDQELLSDPIQLMFMRMAQTAKQSGFSVRTANELQAAMCEMVANAIEHANPPIPVLIGYHVRTNIASFIVADVGRGVYESLRENPDHRDLVNDHCEAIRKSLQDGVSRHRAIRGNGFRPIFRAIMENWGILRFRSRKGCVTMDGSELTVNRGVSHFPPELPGFQVAVTCRARGILSENPLL